MSKKTDNVVYAITVVLILFISVMSGVHQNPVNAKTPRDTIEVVDSEIIKVEQAALERQVLKRDLIAEVDTYIHKIAPTTAMTGLAIVEACLDYKVDIALVLAQGIQESHFGTKGQASRTHSTFNVVGNTFTHPDHSIRPFLQLLTTKYLVNGRTEQDLLRNYVNARGARYASSPVYESRLRYWYDVIKKNTDILEKFNKLKNEDR